MSDSESTRWTLIREAANGEAAARETFARLYEPVVRSYLGARWAPSPLRHEIDDAVQEAFLACLKEGGALTRVEDGRSGGFRAFLFGVVRNVARRFEERRGRESARAEALAHPSRVAGREETLSVAFDRAWATGLLRRALSLQEERARGKGPHARRRIELLRLRFQEGLPIREIAALWDEDANTLHARFRKAREEFREALREVVREEHDGVTVDLDAECARLAEHFP